MRVNRNAIDAVRQADVRLLVRSSILGADPTAASVFSRHRRVCDEHQQASGIPYRIVQPNLFLQNVRKTPFRESTPTAASMSTPPTPG